MHEPPTGEALEAQLTELAEARLERSDAEAVLTAFSARNGLPALRFDDKGQIAITLAGDLYVLLMYVPTWPGLVAAVPLPDALAARADVACQLLQANLAWKLNAGGTFGRMPETGAFAYCRLLPLAGRDDHAFERDLLAFADQAKDWLERIELALDAEREDAAPQPPIDPSSYG